jgi:acyl-CoA hydrolase
MRVVTEDVLRRRLADLPHASPRIVASGNHAVPWPLLRVADEAIESYRLFMLNAPPGVPDRPGVVLETPFVGAGMRDRPTLAYLPSRLSLVPALIKRQAVPDVVLLNTSTPRGGLVSLGVEVNVLPAAVEAARARGGLVVAALNRDMPYTYGDSQLAVDDIDIAVEVDEPLGELPVRPPDELHARNGARVADLVPEGATLQIGIGAIPDAALAALTSRRSLRIWTEMFSDGLLGLVKAGALADAPLTTSFAAGSQELYDFLDDNRDVVFSRTERTNDPTMISRQPAMTSINAGLQVDLYAEVNASYVRGRIYSGFGGQSDFVVGALHAPGGAAIIALPSWHRKSQCSTVVSQLDGPATSFQHSFIVTEHGVAEIWGRSQREQAAQLVERAAAPEAREELREAAASLGLAPS